MRDNRKWELYLTHADNIVIINTVIICTITFVFGLFARVMSAILESSLWYNVSLISVCTTLGVLFITLSWFVIGVINLRVAEKKTRYNEIKDIVSYCYPSMDDKQYKKYLKLVKKGIRKNKHCLMTLHFDDFKLADEWAQTVEFITLENKWTYQLSQQYGYRIKA